MMYKYGEVPPNQIAAEKKYFLSAIFKLLPYKEENYLKVRNSLPCRAKV